jgi:molybdopterin-binding protein
MSQFIATVSNIENCESVHIVTFDFQDQTLFMVSLELNENIQVGTKVRLTVKPTHISLAKNFSGDVSFSNQLRSTVISIEKGQLLAAVKLEYFDTVLESIITVHALKNMDLNKGDEVTALIRASELSIQEVLND